MTLALLCGAGVGLGLWLVVRGLFPPRPSLAHALAQLRRLPEPAPVLTPEANGGMAARLGRPIAGYLTRTGAGWLLPAGVRRGPGRAAPQPRASPGREGHPRPGRTPHRPRHRVVARPGRGACARARTAVGIAFLDGGRVLPSRPRRPRRRQPTSPRLSPRVIQLLGPRRGGLGRRRRRRDGARRRGLGRVGLGVRLPAPGARPSPPGPPDPVGRARTARPGAGRRRALRAGRLRRPGRHRRGQGPRLPLPPKPPPCVPISWPKPRPPTRPPPNA